MSYAIGDRVGDYQIVEVLGAGGMGKVYKVRNAISERVEAMKVLLPNLESDPDLADRFMREIKVQASLQHPNIAALHTAQRVNNQLVMLIEFVEGQTLEAELRKGRVPVLKAIDYVRQVLLALSYAHSRGVVHRDIKPANMMLTPSGTVKLMDFGIARLSQDRRLTQTGRTVGSLYYMSPEQIQGALDLDARSDLYSLGVSLYELVTAQRPFQGDSDYSIMAAHLNASPVPPIKIDPGVPELLSEVILMAIAKDPAKRFQTADAFRAALESVAAQLGVPKAQPVGSAAAAAATPAPMPPPLPMPVAGPAPAKSRRGLYMALGSVATIVVLVLLAMQAPKLFRSSAASVSTIETAQPPAQAQTPVQQQPAQAETPPPQTPNLRTAPTQTPAAINDAGRTASPPASVTRPAAPAQVQTYQQAPAQVPPPQQQAQQQPPPPQQATQQVPQQPAVDPARMEALRSGRETLVMLGTRVNSVKQSLATMKQQQARMGVNMNADVLTAEQRMEFYLDEAQNAIRTGDVDRMQKALQQGERALERVEKFLGR